MFRMRGNGLRIGKERIKMRRTSGNNAVCFKNFEETLAGSPETYRHIDLIAFGFPCQDISQANSKGKGLQGKRSSIFFECMRIVNIFKPAWLLVENVPRLLSINEGRDMATVLQTMAKSGYGWVYRLLDSQFFGVAQRRRRVFIIGCLGRIPPPEILFEQTSGRRNDKKKQKMGQRGLCISTKCGDKQDPTAETFIASTIGTSTNPDPNYGTHFIAEKVRIAPCLSAHEQAGSIESEGRIRHLVAQTIGSIPRGNTSFVWQDTYIAETNTRGKRATPRIPSGMDSRRGIVIGNAVTVNVAEWIGRRIIKYGK